MNPSKRTKKSYQATTLSLSSARRVILGSPEKKTNRSLKNGIWIRRWRWRRSRQKISRKGTGVLSKINYTTGFSNFITGISFTNISEELTKSSKVWLISFKPEKQNNAEVTTRRWKKNIIHFTKSSLSYVWTFTLASTAIQCGSSWKIRDISWRRGLFWPNPN